MRIKKQHRRDFHAHTHLKKNNNKNKTSKLPSPGPCGSGGWTSSGAPGGGDLVPGQDVTMGGNRQLSLSPAPALPLSKISNTHLKQSRQQFAVLCFLKVNKYNLKDTDGSVGSAHPPSSSCSVPAAPRPCRVRPPAAWPGPAARRCQGQRSLQDRAHLQTLGGALMGPSVLGAGGATDAGQKLLRVSTNPGEGAAALGKAGAARFAR